MAAALALPNEQQAVAPAGLPLEMARALSVPLPPEAIKPHPTKDYLSSVKAIYVIERLNDVFGIGGWTYKTQVIESSPDSPMVVMLVVLKVPAYGIRLEQYGGSDNKDRGDAYKGAVTDALSKIGSYLGIAMDVYKGGGPTKQNPRGIAVARKPVNHTPAQQAVVNSKLSAVGRQAAPALAERIPEEHEAGEVTYEEVEMDPEERSQLERELAASIDMVEKRKANAEMLEAFGDLKRRYRAINALKTYYAILGIHGQQEAGDFTNSNLGREEAASCYKELLADLRRREAGRR